MATFSARTTYDNYDLKLYVNETAVDTANNKSTVSWSIAIKNNGARFAISSFHYDATINGTEVANYTGSGATNDIASDAEKTFASGTLDVYHNSDGTKTIGCSANCSGRSNGHGPGPGSVSGNVTLTNIPRQTSITSFNVNKRDETSFTFSWSTADTIDYLWYSTNNGSSWSGYDTPDGTSGSFTVSGLAANTSYNCKIRVRRKEGQQTTDSGTVSQTTYQYPYVSAVGSNPLTIGNSQTLTLYNPLSRNCTVYMKQNNTSGTQIYSGTTNSTSITFTPAANTMYASIPNSQSGNAVYYCTYSGQTVTTKSGTYKIIGTEVPNFASEDWSYTCDLTDLTHSDLVPIDGYSTIAATINNVATSDYSATITGYTITWGSKHTDITTTSGSVAAGSGSTLKITAHDSRGLSKETTKTVPNVAYSDISIAGFSATGYLNGNRGAKIKSRGTWFNSAFGGTGEFNKFSSAKYYISTDNSTWSQAYPADDSLLDAITVDGNSFTINDFIIYSDGDHAGFQQGITYYVKLELKDAQNKLSTATRNTTVVISSKVARDVYRDGNGEYHTGINGIAVSGYNEQIYGSLNVTGGIYSEGVEIGSPIYSTSEQVVGTWTNGKPIYRKVFVGNLGSTANSWADIGTIGSNISEIVSMHGVVGNYLPVPVYISNAYFVALQWNGTKLQGITAGYTGAAIKVIVEYTKTS